jgi:transcription antitermination factor NusG
MFNMRMDSGKNVSFFFVKKKSEYLCYSKYAMLTWYAVYTRSRFEKRLMNLLMAKGIEAYVPLRKVMKQWSDRKKMVEEPLIRSYCFVKVDPQFYQDVLNTPGAVRYVWFSGKPASIPERQIELLKIITGAELEIECLPDTFKPGIRVRVSAGPMQGLTGELVSISNKKKVIIRIDHLNQVITLSISPALIEIAK